jgi:hypothetical protein
VSHAFIVAPPPQASGAEDHVAPLRVDTTGDGPDVDVKMVDLVVAAFTVDRE